jgi:purine-cytosine permease-like protein
MIEKRKNLVASLGIAACLPLWGGTGRPSDGFLSFILLLGFLLIILGILHLADHLKRRIDGLLEGIAPLA